MSRAIVVASALLLASVTPVHAAPIVVGQGSAHILSGAAESSALAKWKLPVSFNSEAFRVGAEQPDATHSAVAENPHRRSSRPNVVLLIGGSLLAGLAVALLAGGSRDRSECPGGGDVCIQ